MPAVLSFSKVRKQQEQRQNQLCMTQCITEQTVEEIPDYIYFSLLIKLSKNTLKVPSMAAFVP